MNRPARFSALLGILALAGSAALMGPACTITTSDNVGGFGGDPIDESGGRHSGGQNTGGKSSGGQSTGGSLASGGKSSGGSAGESSGGNSGTGGDPSLDCQTDGTTEGTYQGLTDMPTPCDACLEDLCLTEWEACNAAQPSTACRWGSTSYVVGESTVSGEFDCMLSCFRDLGDEFVGDKVDVDQCAEQCGSAECDEDAAGPVAIALSQCLIESPSDLDGCQYECEL